MHGCAYRRILVKFEWDEHKARINLRKHWVDFADAVTVLNDDLAIVIPDETSAEERFVALGSDLMGRIIVVVFVPRGQSIRIISARRATRGEAREYPVKQ